MSSLKRAKAAMVLATLLSFGGAAPAALSAQGAAGAQQRAVGIVALRTAAEGSQTRIVIEGTAELPYSIYRPDERTVLVDLPGVDAAKLNDSYAVGSSGVERIQVERLRTASGQSLARLRVRLLSAVEERTAVEGNNLVVTLTGEPAAPRVVAAASREESKPEDAVTMRAEAAPAPAKPLPVSVPSKAAAPAVPANAASVISGVRTEVKDGQFFAYVATDGRAPFKHFVLPDPDRIVLDVTGVRSAVDRNSLEVNGGGISRIRIGQFRTADPRIVRIVFDVAKMGPYTVRQVGTELVLALGDGGAPALAGPAKAAPAPAPARVAEPAAEQPKPSARPATVPSRAPIVGDEDDAAAAAAKPAAKPAVTAPAAPKALETPAPAAAETGAKTAAPAAAKPSAPEASPKPAAEPARMPAPATPTRTVSDETVAASTAAPARQNSTRPLQTRPPSPVAPSASQEGYGTEGFVGKVINFDLKGVDIRDLLRFLHAQVGVNFIVDQSVPAVPVTLSIRGVPWNVTLDAVLRANGLGAVREGQIIRISTQAGIATERQAALASEQARFLSLPLVTRIFRLKYILAATGGPPIGANNQGSQGSNQGQVQIRQNNPFLIIIRNRLSPRGTVEIDPRSNRMIVTDLAARIEVVEQIIRVLDRPEPQVEIEARIVVANRSFLRDIGVQLSAAVVNRGTGGLVGITTLPNTTEAQTGGGGGGGGGGTDGQPPETEGTPGIAFGNTDPSVPGGLAGTTQPVPSIRATGATTVVSLTTGILGTFQISAQITANETKGLVRTIAAPRVTAQNNTLAEVVNGIQIPVQTVTNNTVTTTFVTAALRLQITPVIVLEDGAIQLSVLVENNTVNLAVVSLGTPGINTQSSSTVVIVPDGGTTIIGGVNIDAETQAETRTPGLARIPILGNLFKRRQTRRETDEILFFITPRIFRPELVGIPEGTTVRTGDITIQPLIPAGSEGVSAPAGLGAPGGAGAGAGAGAGGTM